MSQTESSQTVTSTDQQVSLSLADLQSFCQIVEVCSQRGAFKAEEMAGVGALYNKTIAFLKQSGALPEQQPQQPEQPTNQ